MGKLKEYNIFMHARQGDDFRHWLDENDGDVPAALRAWAAAFKANEEHCLRLANAFHGRSVVAHADAHSVVFEPTDEDAEGLFEVLVKEEVLNVYELEEEEYGEDDDYDDDDDDEYEDE